MILVGSARSDEHNKLTGGKAGDQKQTSNTNDTKGEVSLQNFYVHSKGWYVLRPKDIKIANKIATAMKNACLNKHIGYNQYQRYGLVEQVKKTGSTKGVTKDVNTDCSATVRACCIEAGFDPGDFNTENEAATLEKTGKFEKIFSYTSSTPLYNGDILVTKTKGHTVVVVSGNPRKEEKTTEKKTETKKTDTKWKISKKEIPVLAKPILKYGSKGTEAGRLQADLNYCGASLKIDNIVGEKTVKALKAWQKKNKLTEDGIYGTKSRDKMKTLLK